MNLLYVLHTPPHSSPSRRGCQPVGVSTTCPKLDRHLPLDGGGWEGVGKALRQGDNP